MRTLSATLPGGKKIVVRELTGEDELHATAEAGTGPEASARFTRASVMRSLVSVDGEKIDASTHTPDSIRAMFTPKEFQFVCLAHQELNEVTREEAAAFRRSFEIA